MAKRIFLGVLLAVSIVVLPVRAMTARAAPSDCALAADTGAIPALTSLTINFNCATAGLVYFAACDSGGVANDDLFTITVNNAVVSSNRYENDIEFVSMGSLQLPAGPNTAVLNSVNDTPFPPATYSYAIASDAAQVQAYVEEFCGADFGGFNSTVTGCGATFPVFTTDTAPTAGELRLDVQFGSFNREEGQTWRVWSLKAGERVNNDTVSIPAPNYVRLWWKPAGGTQWFLLPSQYWTGAGDGTIKSEYGLACGGATPSYHTSFSRAIPDSNVPLLTFPAVVSSSSGYP
jgi:hypothetical protein